MVAGEQKKVDIQWKLYCMVQNIGKLAKFGTEDKIGDQNRGQANCAAGQGRVIERVRIPSRKEGHPPGS
ncbi:MAG: hypothetical protein KKD44_16970, partial [Proteobacteria bacterium]|nr:hypothetical protein [Pseudomonadota bacterium]